MIKELQEFLDDLSSRGEILGKSGVKLAIVAIILKDLDWKDVDKFALEWTTVDDDKEIPLPIVAIHMKNGENKVVVPDEEKISFGS